KRGIGFQVGLIHGGRASGLSDRRALTIAITSVNFFDLPLTPLINLLNVDRCSGRRIQLPDLAFASTDVFPAEGALFTVDDRGQQIAFLAERTALDGVRCERQFGLHGRESQENLTLEKALRNAERFRIQ